jgi:hypothetical protein
LPFMIFFNISPYLESGTYGLFPFALLLYLLKTLLIFSG